MNVRLFGLAAAMTMAMGVVACGDDETGSGGAPGTGGGSSTATGDTTASSGTGTPSSSSGGDGDGGDDTSSTSTGEGGDPGVGGAGGGEGGAPPSGPCAEVCADDAGCDLDPADPGDECGGCVSEEASNQSACALEGALGSCCADFDGCSDYVNCVLGGGTTEECAVENPEGGARAQACVLQACGACGNPE